MKNWKMCTAITASIITVTLGCILLLYLIANTTTTRIMKQSNLKHLNVSLQIQAGMIEDYISHQEDMLRIFSNSSNCMNYLYNREDPYNQERVVGYLDHYFRQLKNWDSLYIADWDTKVLVHSDRSKVGVYARNTEESRNELRENMLKKDGIYNAAVLHSSTTGGKRVSLYSPIFDDDGRPLGYVGGGPSAQDLREYMGYDENIETKYFLINVAEENYIFATDESLIAKDTKNETLLTVLSNIKSNHEIIENSLDYVDENGNRSIMVYRYMPEYNWVLVASNTEANVYVDVYKNMKILAGLCFLTAILTGLLSWISVLVGTRPLAYIRDAIVRLQAMNFDKLEELTPYVHTKSEVGEIATAIDSLYDSIGQLLQDEKEKQSLAAANESKARFLASMSHEIRTPLNTVIGMNEIILRENTDPMIREYALNIKNEGQLLLGLISDVLDFSKIEAGKLMIVEKPYKPRQMLEETVRAMMSRINEKRLNLITEFDASIPTGLLGDETRIRQILNNLLSNAIKYTEKGEIYYKCSCEQKNNMYWISFTVSDTGVGIRKEEIGSIFETFKRLDLDRKEYIQGTGLGLNITKQLAESMGGSITVESVYGEGSTFLVSLPQQKVNDKDEVIVHKMETAMEFLRFPDKKILAVDDNKMNLTVLRGLLKRNEVQVELANSGDEGIEKMKNTKYDLVLMDHMMPEMDGIEVLHAIRADVDNPNRDTTMVVLTANAIAGMEQTYLDEGFAAYLTKPISIEHLEETLEKYLA